MIAAGPWLKDISSTAIIIIYTTSATSGFSKPHLKWLYRKSAIVLKILAIVVLQNLGCSHANPPQQIGFQNLGQNDLENTEPERDSQHLSQKWVVKTSAKVVGCSGHAKPWPERGSTQLSWKWVLKTSANVAVQILSCNCSLIHWLQYVYQLWTMVLGKPWPVAV